MHRASRVRDPPLKHNTPHRGQKHQWLSVPDRARHCEAGPWETAIFALIFKTFSLTHFTQAWQCVLQPLGSRCTASVLYYNQLPQTAPNPAPPANSSIHHPTWHSQPGKPTVSSSQVWVSNQFFPSSIFSPLPDHKRRRLKWRTVVLV